MSETTKTEVTTTVMVADLIPGERPALIAVKRAVNSQGVARHLTQKVRISSTALAQRLFAEVQRGDEITLTLTTTWSEESYETLLTDFVLPIRLENTMPLAKEHHAAASS